MSLILPDFIIGGERRCGTTSLLKNLSQHPEIFGHSKQDKSWFIEDSVRKKPDFSPWEETHKIEDYSKWFQSENPTKGAKIGEKSADYLFWRECHERLGQYLPETKFIFILRNPVKRAWSHYWNEVAKGREKLSFAEAIESEPERIGIDDYHRYNFSYVQRGLYSESLKHFFKYIPQKRCLVLPVEMIWRSPKNELSKICDFLDVDTSFNFPDTEKAFNANWAVFPKQEYRGKYTGLMAETYARLAGELAKLAIKNRNERREALIKWKRPFYDAARDLKIPQETHDFLVQGFEEDKKNLQDLTGLDLGLWG